LTRAGVDPGGNDADPSEALAITWPHGRRDKTANIAAAQALIERAVAKEGPD
jgi:hypothetical protein